MFGILLSLVPHDLDQCTTAIHIFLRGFVRGALSIANVTAASEAFRTVRGVDKDGGIELALIITMVKITVEILPNRFKVQKAVLKVLLKLSLGRLRRHVSACGTSGCSHWHRWCLRRIYVGWVDAHAIMLLPVGGSERKAIDGPRCRGVPGICLGGVARKHHRLLIARWDIDQLILRPLPPATDECLAINRVVEHSSKLEPRILAP